jgi:hypothetical protein
MGERSVAFGSLCFFKREGGVVASREDRFFKVPLSFFFFPNFSLPPLALIYPSLFIEKRVIFPNARLTIYILIFLKSNNINVASISIIFRK